MSPATTAVSADRIPYRSAGATLIGAAVLGWLGVIVRSHHGDIGVRRQLAEVADSPAREMLAAGSWIAATMLFIAAGVLAAVVAHERRERTAFIGGLLLAVGGAWISTAPAAAAVVLHAFGTGGLDANAAEQVGRVLNEDQGWLVVVPMILCFIAAPVLLFLGLGTIGRTEGRVLAGAWIVGIAGAIATYGDRTGETIACGAMMMLHSWIGVALWRRR